MKRTLYLDVDGVLAHYDGSYVPGRIGEPIAGAASAVDMLKKNDYAVIAYSMRDLDDVWKWLKENKMDVDGCEEKPSMYLNVAARTVRFNGSWSQTLIDIAQFKPWYKK